MKDSKFPPRWRPFKRREEIERRERHRAAQIEIAFRDFTEEMVRRGKSRFDVGLITQAGYQGGMDADLAEFIDSLESRGLLRS